MTLMRVSVVRLDNLRHGVGEVVKKHGLRQHGCARDLFVDTFNGVAVDVSGDENDRRVAHPAKPPSDLYAFAASFQINVLRRATSWQRRWPGNDGPPALAD